MRAGVLLLVLLAPAGAGAGGIDGPTRRALAEVKRLCDRGLVAPAVCMEKQRALLGLGQPAQAPATPPPAPAVPAASAAEAASRVGDGTPYDSALGVRLVLPPGWIALTGDALDQGFAVLKDRLQHEPNAAALVEQVRRRSQEDGIEVFASGGDQLQMTRSAAAPPPDAAAARRFCDALPTRVPVVPGKVMRTWTCEPRTVAGRATLYLERDAVLPDTRTLQYWIALPDGTGLQLVLTCAAARAEARRSELTAMVASLGRR